ncbi:MAG: NUDIX hydrolase [Cyclobacteriaceae bacterium]
MTEEIATNKVREKYYQGTGGLLVAVDSIIFGFDTATEKLRLLLFNRKVEPHAGQYSLVGSFVNENEDLYDAAQRILYDLAGVSDVFLEQLKTYGKVARDPGARVISVAYYSLIRLDQQHDSLVQAHNARWIDIDNLPPLVLDHDKMVADALEKLGETARHRPIGFELLPERFTLRQIKMLYQQIYQRQIDDRNFRKKMLATGLIIKQPSKDKSTSRKGSYHYQFDRKKYKSLVKEGFNIRFS